MSRASANLLLLVAGAIWGMGFVAQSTAMAAMGPLLFVGLRFALAAAALLPLAVVETRRKGAPVGTRMLAGFCLCGLALFGAMALQQIGLVTTSVTNAGFLTGLYVVVVPLIALLALGKPPHPIVWPSAAAALAGIWLLSGGALAAMRPGDMLTVAGAALFAVQVILLGIVAPASGRPLLLSFVQFAVCGLAGLVGAVLIEPVSVAAIRAAAPELVYAGLFSSAVAFTLQVVGQRYTTAPQAAIFMSSEALFAALFGALLLGERIDGAGYVGCALIFAAILAVEILPGLRPGARAGRAAGATPVPKE